MQHIEEHILELYVLNSDKVLSRRGEIEAHLARCHGCRSLAARMTETYRDVEVRFNKLNERADSPAQALTQRPARVAPAVRTDAPPAVAYRPVTRVQQLTYFVRRHPVVIGSGSFVAMAGLALLGNLLLKAPGIMDRNPAHIHYNIGSNKVEILNQHDQMLWNLMSKDVGSIEAGESETGSPKTAIADINNDGLNEVLTTLWTPEDALRTEIPLRVYDGKGGILFSVQLEKQIKYLNRNYPNTWGADRVIVGKIDASGQKQIICSFGSGRSPVVITRLDSKGNVIGELLSLPSSCFQLFNPGFIPVKKASMSKTLRKGWLP